MFAWPEFVKLLTMIVFRRRRCCYCCCTLALASSVNFLSFLSALGRPDRFWRAHIWSKRCQLPSQPGSSAKQTNPQKETVSSP